MVLIQLAQLLKGVSLTETLNLLNKLNYRQVFDFIDAKPSNFIYEINQLEKYTFSAYSDDLWEYEPQAKTDEFATYLKYTYKDKWQNIYKNGLQNFGSTFSISQDSKQTGNNNFIKTNDGFDVTVNGDSKSETQKNVSANSLNINDIKSFFTIVLDDIKKEILIYKGE